jgi:hypothetical protein
MSRSQVQAGETPSTGKSQVYILQHFTTCLAAKFRLEKRQPRGNLRYRSCSNLPRVSQPSSGWRNASRGGTSGIDPAAFHHVSRSQVQAGETPAGGGTSGIDPAAIHHVSRSQVQAGEMLAACRYRSCSISPRVSRPSSGWRNASRGNLRYRSCSILPCVSRPSLGLRNASCGGTSGKDPAAFHQVSRSQVQAGETPAMGEP